MSAAGPGREVRWYETSHEFNDRQSPRDRERWLARKLRLAAEEC